MVTTEGRETEKTAYYATWAELDAAKLDIFKTIREDMLSQMAVTAITMALAVTLFYG